MVGVAWRTLGRGTLFSPSLLSLLPQCSLARGCLLPFPRLLSSSSRPSLPPQNPLDPPSASRPANSSPPSSPHLSGSDLKNVADKGRDQREKSPHIPSISSPSLSTMTARSLEKKVRMTLTCTEFDVNGEVVSNSVKYHKSDLCLMHGLQPRDLRNVCSLSHTSFCRASVG